MKNKLKNKCMKRLMPILVVWLSCHAAFSTDVQINLADSQFGITRTTNRLVIVQPWGVSQSGSWTLLQTPIAQYTDTNGATTFSNLYGSDIQGVYHVTVPAPPSRSDFDIWVQSTNLGTVQASAIIISPGSSTYPPGAWAWSATASDARYAAIGSASGGTTNVDGFVTGLATNNTLSASGTNTVNALAAAQAQAATQGMVTNGGDASLNSAAIGNVTITGSSGQILSFGLGGIKVNAGGPIEQLGSGDIKISGSGKFSGNGSSLTNIPYSALTGTPTIPSTSGLLATNGNGGALTNLNASQITSGTVPDARLSGNVLISTERTNDANTYGFNYEAGPTNSVSQVLGYHGLTVFPWHLMRFYNAVDPSVNTGPIRIFNTGDSLSNAGQGPWMSATFAVWSKVAKFGGSIGESVQGGITVGPTVTTTSNDTNWYATTYIIPPGGTITNVLWSGSSWVPATTNADIISIGLLSNFDTSTNLSVYAATNWGELGDLVATIQTSNSTCGFYGTNIAKYGTYYTVLKNNDAVNSAKVFWVGNLINNEHTFQTYGFPLGGHKCIQGWLMVSNNIFTDAMRFLNPALAITQNHNSTTNEISGGVLENYFGLLKSAFTNGDLLMVGTTINTNDDPISYRTQNQMMREVCIESNVMYADMEHQFDLGTMNALGMHTDGAHLSSTKSQILPWSVWSEVFNSLGGIDWANYQYFEGSNNTERRKVDGSIGSLSFGKLIIHYPTSEGLGTNLMDTTEHGYNAWIVLNGSTNYWRTGKYSYAVGDIWRTNYTYASQVSPVADIWQSRMGMTMCFWMRTTNTIDGVTAATGFGNYYDSTSGGMGLYWYPNATTVVTRVNSRNHGIVQNYNGSTASSTTINDGQWHFVALTYDNYSLVLRIDGTTVTTTTSVNGPMLLSFTPFAIGGTGVDWSDFRVYCPGLTSAQLSEVYSAGFPLSVIGIPQIYLVDGGPAAYEGGPTNSTSLYASTNLQSYLIPGTYYIESFVYGSGSSSSSSFEVQNAFTGTGTSSAVRFLASGSVADYAANATLTSAQTGSRDYNTLLQFNYGGNKAGLDSRSHKFAVTAPGIYSVKFGTPAAVSDEFARIFAGSYLKITRLK